MNIYFDFSNFVSFIHSYNDDRYKNCEEMLFNNFDIKLTFPKEALNEVNDDVKNDVLLWFTRLSCGKGNLSWCSTFPQSPISIDTICKWPHLNSVYCLDGKNRKELESLKEKGIVLVANVGSEIDAISNLLINSNQYTREIFHSINNWDDLKKYTSPCSDIIIVDQYIFSSPEVYSCNIYKILQCLTENTKEEKVNIVFVTLRRVHDKRTHKDFYPNWDKIYSQLREKISKKHRPNITFVTTNDEQLDHDRTIFTNYKIFTSGDSFIYFDNAGNRITHGRWMYVHSLADVENMKNAFNFLEDIQKLVDNINKKNENNILKDKVSYLLNLKKK